MDPGFSPPLLGGFLAGSTNTGFIWQFYSVSAPLAHACLTICQVLVFRGPCDRAFVNWKRLRRPGRQGQVLVESEMFQLHREALALGLKWLQKGPQEAWWGSVYPLMGGLMSSQRRTMALLTVAFLS